MIAHRQGQVDAVGACCRRRVGTRERLLRVVWWASLVGAPGRNTRDGVIARTSPWHPGFSWSTEIVRA